MRQPPYLPRPDFRTAKQVEQGIAVQEALDTHAAALFLQSRGVDMAIAMRVLTRPDQRRRSH